MYQRGASFNSLSPTPPETHFPPKMGGGDKTGFLDFLAKNRKMGFFAIILNDCSAIDGHFEYHYKTPVKWISGVLVSALLQVFDENDQKSAKMAIFDPIFAFFDLQKRTWMQPGLFLLNFGHKAPIYTL